MRERIYEIIELAKEDDTASHVYDLIMMITIGISMIPLMVKGQPAIFLWLDRITVIIFIIDYILRFITADYKLKKGKLSFLKYPFTLMAIIDLLAILPSLIMLNPGLKVLKVVRMLRAFRVFRVFKVIRYSRNVMIIVDVFKKSKSSLMVVLWLALGYILISALIIFNIEPETFDTFFDAIYWATVSLTTVGYGDIYPVSFAGKIITMCSSVMGIAVVALPASIITAGYMEELNKE